MVRVIGKDSSNKRSLAKIPSGSFVDIVPSEDNRIDIRTLYIKVQSRKRKKRHNDEFYEYFPDQFGVFSTNGTLRTRQELEDKGIRQTNINTTLVNNAKSTITVMERAKLQGLDPRMTVEDFVTFINKNPTLSDDEKRLQHGGEEERKIEGEKSSKRIRTDEPIRQSDSPPVKTPKSKKRVILNGEIDGPQLKKERETVDDSEDDSEGEHSTTAKELPPLPESPKPSRKRVDSIDVSPRKDGTKRAILNGELDGPEEKKIKPTPEEEEEEKAKADILEQIKLEVAVQQNDEGDTTNVDEGVLDEDDVQYGTKLEPEVTRATITRNRSRIDQRYQNLMQTIETEVADMIGHSVDRSSAPQETIEAIDGAAVEQEIADGVKHTSTAPSRTHVHGTSSEDAEERKRQLDYNFKRLGEILAENRKKLGSVSTPAKDEKNKPPSKTAVEESTEAVDLSEQLRQHLEMEATAEVELSNNELAGGAGIVNRGTLDHDAVPAREIIGEEATGNNKAAPDTGMTSAQAEGLPGGTDRHINNAGGLGRRMVGDIVENTSDTVFRTANAATVSANALAATNEGNNRFLKDPPSLNRNSSSSNRRPPPPHTPRDPELDRPLTHDDPGLLDPYPTHFKPHDSEDDESEESGEEPKDDEQENKNVESTPVFHRLMNILGVQAQEDTESVQRQKVESALRTQNKRIDPLTGGVSPPDILEQSTEESDVQNRFDPASAREAIMQAQHVTRETMTLVEQQRYLEEMRPYWNEFRTIQVNAGVVMMETMPRNLYQSDRSTVRMDSRVRGDLDQAEETFGDFMFWMIHTKMDTTTSASWEKVARWSSSLGYWEMSMGQINWLVTGTRNGDLSDQTDFSNINAIEDGVAQEKVKEQFRPFLPKEYIESLHEQVQGNPIKVQRYPSRHESVTAPPVDKSRHPDGTTAVERQAKQTMGGTPSAVFNIPDPRYSMIGGEQVPNVKVITVENPAYDKSKPDGPTNKKYITKQVPDIGAGSKEINQEIEKAEADRLLKSTKTKLYASIHSQAVDRYLGARNYQRLSLPLEKYMETYAAQNFGPTDITQMYEWNLYIMMLYGPTMYANVGDSAMVRNVPAYTEATPSAVGDEFMELNELVGEMKRYQQVSDDRADRVAGGGVGAKPIEREMGKFFKDQSEAQKEQLLDSNAVVISLPKDETKVLPSDYPGGSMKPPPDIDDVPADINIDGDDTPGTHTASLSKAAPNLSFGVRELDYGISRDSMNTVHSMSSSTKDNSTRRNMARETPISKKQMNINEMSRRHRMFSMLTR